MSASAQTNGKKSSNSSAVNTPASTPVTNGNSQSLSQSTPPPPNNNAPKYGTLVPNRIFVGGISANTTEGELLQLFSNYGTVKAAKIIQDRAGVSKGYGFITFESEDDAKRPLKDADNIVLRERKLNIAPAIKKQPFNRAFDAASPSTVAPGNTAQYFFPPSGGVPFFQGGVTYYQQPPAAPGDPNSQPAVYQTPPVYSAQTGPPQAAPTYPSMMFPPPIYMPQQYMPPIPYDFNYYPNNGGGQYMVGGGQNGPNNGGNNGGSSQQGGPPQMPPSSSPPRPPCYNQLPPYNPDPVYYNVPVYGGGPLEGAPVYSPSSATEAMEAMANGGYPEVSQILGEYCTLGYDSPPDAQGPPLPPPHHHLHHHHHHQQQHRHHPPPTDIEATTTHDGGDQPPPLHYDQSCQLENTDSDRQSKTPVVSLLSMEQHQEKDFVSMQGGRRVKPQPPPPPPQLVYMPPTQPPQYYSFNGPPVRSQLIHKTAAHAQNNNNRDASWRKPRNYTNARKVSSSSYEHGRTSTNDSSSRSSIRTDSNSSANAVVDENKNEEKISTTQAQSQPPMQNFHTYNGRTYQNSVVGRRNPKCGQSQDNNNKKNNFVVVPSAQMRAPPSSQNYVISAAARRNKRATRRNQAGGPLSEIGAGDAPLPNNDVTDACKKLETLKM